MALNSSQRVITTKVIINVVRHKAKVFTHGRTGKFMMASGNEG